jgi:hypothetical protein
LASELLPASRIFNSAAAEIFSRDRIGWKNPSCGRLEDRIALDFSTDPERRPDFSGGLAPSWSKLDSEKNLTSARPTGRDKGDERLQENSSAWRR